jgi:uncharacterized protein YggE
MKKIKYLAFSFFVLGLLFSGCLENQNEETTPMEIGQKDFTSEPPVSVRVSADNVDKSSSVEVVSPEGIASSRNPSLTQAGVSRGIVVSGLGRVLVTPDLAVFTVGVVNTGKTSQETLSENTDAMESIIAALKDAGVDEKDIKTQNVNVWPEFDYGTRDEEKKLPTIIGYRAENRVSVTVKDIIRAGEVIDAATEAGANQLYGLSFTVSEEVSKNLRTRVLGEAVLDATDKAQAIADALGAKKILPISVVESGGYSPPVIRYDVAALEKGAATTPVSPGETAVTASVTVTFDFES